MRFRWSGAVLAVTYSLPLTAFSLETISNGRPSRQDAAGALRRAVLFFRDEVSTRGGYLWKYSTDLGERWGEGKATDSQIWVQPPGTPSVGMACLRAYERTGDSCYLEVARDAAHILAWGQLASGGWGYHIDVSPQKADGFFYRRDLEAGQVDPRNRFNVTTFDDDNSQSALRLLMLYDRASGFKDPLVQRAVKHALNAFLDMQYPNGAWPQRATESPDPDAYPVLKAHYPESWPRTFPAADYKRFYTLNAATIPDCIKTMGLAYEIYQDRRLIESACRGGDFLLLSQMPDPQPAWAQQYNFEMEPVWARRFEPPSVVTRESVDAIKILMELFVRTGEEKYRKPIPRVLHWLQASILPDGRHARFYELETNRPLYFTRQYELVYTDDDLPTHYAFKQNLDLGLLRQAYAQLDHQRGEYVRTGRPTWADRMISLQLRRSEPVSPAKVRSVIKSLDDRGRWVEDGWIHSEMFIRNVDILSRYIAKNREKRGTTVVQPASLGNP